MLWVLCPNCCCLMLSEVHKQPIISKKMSIKSVLWNKWTWASGNNIWQIVPDDWVRVVLDQLHLESRDCPEHWNNPLCFVWLWEFCIFQYLQKTTDKYLPQNTMCNYRNLRTIIKQNLLCRCWNCWQLYG